jgi:hypothetical protein
MYSISQFGIATVNPPPLPNNEYILIKSNEKKETRLKYTGTFLYEFLWQVMSLDILFRIETIEEGFDFG